MELSGGLFLLLMLGVCTTNRIPGKECEITEGEKTSWVNRETFRSNLGLGFEGEKAHRERQRGSVENPRPTHIQVGLAETV